MKLRRDLLVFSALSLVFPVRAMDSSLVDKSSALAAWTHDIIALADSLAPKGHTSIRADILAAAEETMATKDKVLRIVWQQLFKLGSLLYDDLVAWENLEVIDLKRHPYTLNAGVYELYEETGFSAALHKCTTSEQRLEQQAARIEYIFIQAIRAVSLLSQQDLDEVHADYAPLRDFLHELHGYFAKRRGRTHLMQRQRLLEMFASQGDETAQYLLIALNRQLEDFNETLVNREDMLTRAAIKCHERGLLFKGIITLLKALQPTET